MKLSPPCLLGRKALDLRLSEGSRCRIAARQLHIFVSNAAAAGRSVERSVAVRIRKEGRTEKHFRRRWIEVRGVRRGRAKCGVDMADNIAEPVAVR